MTIKPSPKTPAVTKPWSAIKRVSTGITRESIVEQWRQSQPDKLCETCKGGGTTSCDACKGKAIDPATATPCDKCDGTGTTGKCRTTRCADGKIPCPMTCLKPSDFTGKPRADGKRWKRINGKGGGYAEISEGHIGELVAIENGVPVSKGKCPKCGGKSVIADEACHGTGQQPCASCKGAGVVGPKCATCTAGRVACATCSGTGLKRAEAPTTAPAP